jgi:hypothetical protein
MTNLETNYWTLVDDEKGAVEFENAAEMLDAIEEYERKGMAVVSVLGPFGNGLLVALTAAQKVLL